MDAQPENAGDDSLAITGLSHVVRSEISAVDPLPYLRTPKLRKYMGLQDDLAVVAAARALQSAGLAAADLGERAGLYWVMGHIPFDLADIEPLVVNSVIGAGELTEFSPARFSTSGFRAVNGLLTFRCLPNMPVFHISATFNIQGPYLVTYPGPAQFYLAWQEACAALDCGAIDVAIVGAVAQQCNFLVRHHFSRVQPPIQADQLRDSAGCLVLEHASRAKHRGAPIIGRNLAFQLDYEPFDPFESPPTPSESFAGADPLDGTLDGQYGAASLPVALSAARSAGALDLEHRVHTRDGYRGFSRWEMA